jgi:hypothetical protein
MPMKNSVTPIQRHILAEASRNASGLAPEYPARSPRQDDLVALVEKGYLMATLLGYQITTEGRMKAARSMRSDHYRRTRLRA